MTPARSGAAGTVADLLDAVGRAHLAAEGNALTVTVPAAQLEAAVHHLAGSGGRLADLFAAGPDPVVLHLVWALDAERQYLVLKSEAGEATYPPLSDIAPAAFYEECEIYEQFGIRPATGKPLNRVALPPRANGDFPRLGRRPERDPDELHAPHTVGGHAFEFPFGPVRQVGVASLYYGLVTSGEEVVDLYLFTWHKHRGLEWRLRGRAPGEALFLVERAEGLSAVANGWAFAAAAEAALGAGPPPAAQRTRAVALELERLYNHAAATAALCQSTGLTIGQSAAEIALEKLLRLNAAVFGHRYLFGVVDIGGARQAPDAGALRAGLPGAWSELRRAADALLATNSFMDRLEATGIVTAEQARRLGLVGPVARAAGIGIDTRLDQPTRRTGAAAVAGGVSAVWQGNSGVVSAGGSLVVGTVQLQATSLGGVFAALLGLVAVAIAGYAHRYHEPGAGTGIYLAVLNLALAACLAVLAAANVVTFLVAWESVALLCYLLILRHPQRDDAASGAFWFLALSETGFVLVIAAFVILATRAHTTQLDPIAARSHLVPAGWRDTAYLLALAGFGFKAGLVPLHVWLPEAHPVAPADGSAFLSGLVVKLGAYGIALFAFRLLPVGPAWTGLLTMAAGAVTAAIGILYAMSERDIKRFLALSTIENTGIIVTAFGAAMVFGSYGQPELWAFLLLAGLYHTANHGCYKTLLFLEAGVVEHATGTRDMDRLGGLVHRLPRSGVITLVGTLGIAALPPLNGFVSEWMIFQGLFQGFRTGSHLTGILIVLAAATLGLTGGLAIYAFVRGYGIPFLGMPRTWQAASASERGQPVAGPGLLAVACVALSVGAPIVVLALSRAVDTVTGVVLRPVLLPGNLTIIPAHTDFSAFSPTWLAVFLVAVTAVPLLIYRAGRPRAGSVTVGVWDGGMVAFKPRMQYSAMTFSAPTRVTFDALYRPSVSLRRASDDPAGRSGPVHYETEVTPVFQRYLYQPVVRAVEWLADVVRPIQSGDVNLYLLYVFIVILLAYLTGAL